MAQLWGGRFTKDTKEEVFRFNESLSFDRRLFEQDIEGSVAHVVMLEKQHILSMEEKNAIVIGISKDSVASHLKFAEKYDLPFVLLSDPELQAIQAYGVWQEKKLYGKVSMGVVRSTYLIDENGMIEKVMPKVKPDTNAEEILAYLNLHT